MKEARFGGDIGESTVAIVLEKMIGGLLAGGKAFEARAVDEKNVQPAVVVVIIEGDAAAGGFEEILVLVLAAENGLGVEAGFPRDVEEGNAKRLITLTRSQGNVATLFKKGLSERDLGMDKFSEITNETLGGSAKPWYFSTRVRLGIV